MCHAFMAMGIPNRILTDNMKSVVTKRDASGLPVFNKDYDAFQHEIGFKTDLCKVAHPFTKGKVERLVRFVKDNLIVGRRFLNVSDLNREAWKWCMRKNSEPLRGYDFIPMEEHRTKDILRVLDKDSGILNPYLAPVRKISFDGFVCYEGRDFGVPYSYCRREARVMRVSDVLLILDTESFREIQRYDIDWSKKAKVCNDQWSEYAEQPEELPTAPVMSSVFVESTNPCRRFDRFSIRGGKDAE